jgi:sigma-B regulation protein RsbU (phosphoserine phosphatase)
VSSEVGSIISLSQAVVLSYRSDTKDLSETGNYFFEREKKFEAFQIHAWNPESQIYERTVDLAKPAAKTLLTGKEQLFLDALDESKKAPIVLRGIDVASDRLLLVARFGEVSDPRHVVAMTVFEASELAQVFLERGAYLSFLAHKEGGQLIFAPENGALAWRPVWSVLSAKTVPEGIEELETGETRQLASYADVGVGELIVVSLVDKKIALSAVDVLINKSLLFFISLIALSVIFAVIASGSLTYALSKLSFATQKVAQGDFDVRVDIKSGGEIGLLASGFNAMAVEVSRLMKETAEKARMESELATAKAVQDTLFPESTATLGPVQISGHYTSASECGGDWWHYCENGDFVYIWIGDATGHGAPAALLTSAARAVASVITQGSPKPAGECLGVLNRAICETSKGKMMMTFFLAVIDKNTGWMSYSNASHEPPFLLHKTDGEPKRDDFLPMNDVNNPRLGEQVDREFKSAVVQLQPGDTLVFFTDGVVDVKSPEGKNFGERRFVKAMASEVSGDVTASQVVDGVVNSLAEFRQQTPLDDDVTLIVCRFLGTQSQTEQGAA